MTMKFNNNPWEIEFYSPSGGAIDGTPIGNGRIGAMLEANQLDFRLHLAKDNIWYNAGRLPEDDETYSYVVMPMRL